MQPSCTFTPLDTSQVSTFVKIVTSITNCSFAIKSRGHAPAAGFANINDGVLLDLTSINQTTISSDHQVASVGTGSAWEDVYRALQPFNKTVAGGRNGAVGVGGLTLGGGISYYSPQVGFTSDNVINYEVVLASSEVVNANATANTDLFEALQGGGNNFGIVTRIDFAAIDTVDIAEGHLFNSPAYVADVLGAFANIVASPAYDVHASIVVSPSYNATSRQWSVVSVPQYTLPIPDPPVYDELFSIPNITSLTSFSIQNISTLSAEPPYPQFYELFFTSTYAAPSGSQVKTLLLDMFELLNSTLSAQAVPGVFWSLALEPLPAAFTSHSKSPLGNLFGLNTTENAFLYLFTINFANSKLYDQTYTLAQSLLAGMDDLAHQQGLYRDFKYANYADPSQDVFASYGPASVDFLRSVSKKYDPAQVFQQRVPGGFKISKTAEDWHAW